MFGAAGKGEPYSTQLYNDWVAEVKRTVPADRLLIFDVKQGWAPLCKFLGLPVPSVPFPNINNTAMQKKNLKNLVLMSHATVIGVPIIVAVLAWIFWAGLNGLILGFFYMFF